MSVGRQPEKLHKVVITPHIWLMTHNMSEPFKQKKKVLRCSDATGVLCSTPNKAD